MNIPMRAVQGFKNLKKPGDFYIDKKGEYITLLDPNKAHLHIPIAKGSKLEHHWQWDGNREKPTLTPSINVTNGWHGFVTNGELTT